MFTCMPLTFGPFRSFGTEKTRLVQFSINHDFRNGFVDGSGGGFLMCVFKYISYQKNMELLSYYEKSFQY